MTTSLPSQAREFAIEIMQTLSQVLPTGDLGIDLTMDEGAELFTLTTNDPRGIELQVDQVTVMRLEIDYTLTGDRSGTWLKVKESTIALVPSDKGVSFFRYDYLDGAHSTPEAHFNIHAHRDEFIQALVSTGKSQTAKRRRKNFIDKGTLPRLANFHFPVGGKRFRPSLEEILEVAIEEFGLDRRPTWQTALHQGKERHFSRQLKAAVKDDPEGAAESLRQLGYQIENPA